MARLPEERDIVLEGCNPLPNPLATKVSPLKAGLACFLEREGRERLPSVFRMKLSEPPRDPAELVARISVTAKGVC